jgi:hypothetical protein
VSEILHAKLAAEAGDDELHVMQFCLMSILRFIDADPTVRAKELSRPLGILAASLRDLGQGAEPPLLFARPRRGPGCPTGKSFDFARGAIAAGVDFLIGGGELCKDAAKFVASELRRARVQGPGGKPIGANQVLRWRYAIGATASDLAQGAWNAVQANYAQASPEMAATAKDRRSIVQHTISIIRSKGF